MNPNEKMFKNFRIVRVDANHLPDYVKLMSQSFIKSDLHYEYLNWLYIENPLGQFVGYDAFFGDQLVAHYACIPIEIESFAKLCLLSVNTATHPDYQGRGIFKHLAELTFKDFESDFSSIFGVANSQSEKSFVRHLGFTKLGNLELRFGKLDRPLRGSRIYSQKVLKWRAACPGRNLNLKVLNNDKVLVVTSRIKGFLTLRAIISSASQMRHTNRLRTARIGFTLHWRRDARPLLYLPKYLKPSPLSLIYRPMSENLPGNLSSFSFPDFDAV